MPLTKADILSSYIVGALTGMEYKDRRRIADEVIDAARKEGHFPDLDEPTEAFGGHGHREQSRK